MNRLEQARYPYKPKHFGIPFKEIELDSVGSVISGSGLELDYSVNSGHIGVIDFNSNAHMVADLKFRTEEIGQVISFDLRTKDGEKYINSDMHAEKFIRFAFRNFNLMGADIRFWESGWPSWSINYFQFIEGLKGGKSKLDAAKSTWGGKLAYRYGFKPDMILEHDRCGALILFSK